MDKCEHTLRCTDTDDHTQHTWGEAETRWWCVGTDPVAAVNSTNEKTIDGVLIRYGMTLIDYDLRECQITGIQSLIHGTVWFSTTTGMFDGSRLWARTPRPIR